MRGLLFKLPALLPPASPSIAERHGALNSRYRTLATFRSTGCVEPAYAF